MSDMDELKSGVSRRDFLKIAGVAGATIGAGGALGGLIAACGGTEESSTTTAASGATTTAPAGSTTTASAGESTTTSVAAGVEEGREVKIGFVSPRTGPAAGCAPALPARHAAQTSTPQRSACASALGFRSRVIARSAQSVA